MGLGVSKKAKVSRRITALVRSSPQVVISWLMFSDRAVMAATYWATLPTEKAPAQALRHTKA